ncbi:MAG: radical SAM protein [Verrucomicrobiales bacterium]|nr:radical SAM protein [Verrucomicrobiales bacterium]
MKIESYASNLERFRELYREVDRSEIMAAWDRCTNPNLHVYVHTPFCASVCKFCYYKGVEFDKRSEEALYRQYFDDYLPRTMEPFFPVIESKTVRNYFFGGGTPSLMSLETMEALFNRLPKFRETDSKTFEVHPAVWSREQIDLLADFGFSCCIVGVQSYDAEVLARQNRLYASPDSIHELVDYIKSKGMAVAGDLIYYMDRINADQIFAQDLEHAHDSGFDILSLQLNYDLLKKKHLNDRFFDLVMRSRIASDYIWEFEGERTLTVEYKQTLKCLRVIRKDVSREDYRDRFFNFIPTMDEGSKHLGKLGQRPSVIGFGSYRNPRKNTFSNIRDNDSLYEYIEVNDDWEPRHFVTYEWYEERYFDDAIAQLNELRELGPPPKGLRLCFENKLNVKNEDHIIREPDSQAVLSVVWDYRDESTDRYIDQLRLKFPHWKWNR